MEYKCSWNSMEEGEKNCYLMANGLGGYQSLTVTGGVARGDQTFFMSARKAPNVRRHLVTNLMETVCIGEKQFCLLSQRMKDGKALEGQKYMTGFFYDMYPQWTYVAEGITIKKSACMKYGENTVAVQYEFSGEIPENTVFTVKPMLRMTAKNEPLVKEKQQAPVFGCEKQDARHGRVCKDADELYMATDGVLEFESEAGALFGELYFSQDERDGREETGFVYLNPKISADLKNRKKLTILFSTSACDCEKTPFEAYAKELKARKQELLQKCSVTSQLGERLVLSADAYVVERASTGGKSILAGFPFFEDWGRDTMIALPGITMVTGRLNEAKSILKTFAKYEKKGLLPNLFPEGDENPMYNSVDAPLLFINTVYEYLQYQEDAEFLQEVYPVLQRIVSAYEAGTDFHIGMDTDGLIAAGAGLEQLTWMDVRVGEFLPTPRHGKPVEINAYWCSALKVMEQFATKLSQTAQAEKYAKMAQQAKQSFLEKFWNEEEQCFKDVLSGTEEEHQVRCNQIWTLTQPFVMADAVQEKKVLQKIRDELYTTAGLRTLSPKDKAFHEIYIGPMEQRDCAYHQGTVWAFPLGAYYRACIRYLKRNPEDAKEWKAHVAQGMEELLSRWLTEGCLGHLAEIYDGGTPTVSRGCYAQAWSVGELLRAVSDWERFLEEEVH